MMTSKFLNPHIKLPLAWLCFQLRKQPPLRPIWTAEKNSDNFTMWLGFHNVLTFVSSFGRWNASIFIFSFSPHAWSTRLGSLGFRSRWWWWTVIGSCHVFCCVTNCCHSPLLCKPVTDSSSPSAPFKYSNAHTNTDWMLPCNAVLPCRNHLVNVRMAREIETLVHCRKREVRIRDCVRWKGQMHGGVLKSTGIQ